MNINDVRNYPAGDMLDVIISEYLHVELDDYSTKFFSAWTLNEKMSMRMDEWTWKGGDFLWYGPLYKPKTQYLTTEGFPLDTTCWYVDVINNGRRAFICADTPALAICRAILFVKYSEEEN